MRAHRQRFAASVLVLLSIAGTSSRAPPARAHCEAYPPDEQRDFRGLDPRGPGGRPIATDGARLIGGGSLATHDQWTWTAAAAGRREVAVLVPEADGRVPVQVPWSSIGTDVLVALLPVRSPSGAGYFLCVEWTPYGTAG